MTASKNPYPSINSVTQEFYFYSVDVSMSKQKAREPDAVPGFKIKTSYKIFKPHDRGQWWFILQGLTELTWVPIA